MYVAPAAGDMGLSIGSAYALYYNILLLPRTPQPESPTTAYLGCNKSASEEAVQQYLGHNHSGIKIEEIDDVGKAAPTTLKPIM